MSRKKNRRAGQRKKPRPTLPPRFAVGDRVRVKPGVIDPDFPDVPLGGWAGVVAEVNPRSNPPGCLVEWNDYTLEHMHPIYRKRCERDGLDVDCMWLAEVDLEPDTGGLVVMEQPTNIVTRPLRMSDIDDRVRMVFGLTSDDPLPEATDENVRRYRDYLAAHLSFPFPARSVEEIGPFEEVKHPLTILGLLDAKECDAEDGVVCAADCQGEIGDLPLADLEVVGNPEVRRLIDDYSYWFGNYPPDDPDAPRLEELLPPELRPPRSDTWEAIVGLLGFGLVGALYGIVVASLLATVPGSRTGALLGALLLGLLGLWLGGRYGRLFGGVNRLRYGPAAMAALGALGGGAAGALLGVLAAAIVGTLTGGFLGGLVGRLLKGPAGGGWVWAVVGAGLGAVGLAFYIDPDTALAEALRGAWMGAVGGMVLALVLAWALNLARSQGRWGRR